MDRKTLQEDMARFFAEGGKLTQCGDVNFTHEFDLVEKQLKRDSNGRPSFFNLAVYLDGQEELTGLLIGYSKGRNLQEGMRYRAHLDPSPDRRMYLKNGGFVNIAFGVDSSPVVCGEAKVQFQEMPKPSDNL